jgi:hypothetical protein
MRQESVKPHPDAQACGNPPEHNREQQRFPTKDKECSHGAHMKKCDKNRSVPVNALGLVPDCRFVAHSKTSFSPLSQTHSFHRLI